MVCSRSRSPSGFAMARICDDRPRNMKAPDVLCTGIHAVHRSDRTASRSLGSLADERFVNPCVTESSAVKSTNPTAAMRSARYGMTTTVGIRSKDGVVLAADKRASKGFFVGSKVVQKIFPLDDTIAVAIAGAMSDAEYLVNLAKAERRLLTLRRGFPLSVKESAKLISNIVYSSMKSYNPFYVELVVAGVDREGAHVYTSDMSGAITSEDFMSSGSGSPIAYGVLEQGFRKEFSLEDARKLAEAAVRAAMERDPGSVNGVDVLAIPNGHALDVN